MIKIILRHQVKDFAQWFRTYKQLAPMRERYGVQSEEVYSAVGDPDDVTVTHTFNTLPEATAILESAEVRSALVDAGVVGEPTAWLVTPAG